MTCVDRTTGVTYRLERIASVRSSTLTSLIDQASPVVGEYMTGIRFAETQTLYQAFVSALTEPQKEAVHLPSAVALVFGGGR